MSSRWESRPEGEFEPGSRGRVLRNLLGIPTLARGSAVAPAELSESDVMSRFSLDEPSETEKARRQGFTREMCAAVGRGQSWSFARSKEE
jgi:hypothetical protein